MKTKTTNPAYVLTGRAEIRLKLEPGYSLGTNKFSFGSVEGLLLLTQTTYELVAVVNTRLNNGTFAKLLHHLKALGQQHGRDVVVAEIHNPTLGAYLARVHGYTLIPGTRNAFLPVGGPGTVPPVFTTPPKAGPMDKVLTMLTSIAY